jgi:hypothetical protein
MVCVRLAARAWGAALLVALALALGCARPLWHSQPRSPRVQRASVQRAQCDLRAGRELWCASAGNAPRPVALPFAPRLAARRYAGGAYVLGTAGQLARVAGDGRVTGSFATDLTTLTTTQDYVCGLTAAGEPRCARDHHHDRLCPGMALEAWQRLALDSAVPRVRVLRSDRSGSKLCSTDAAGRQRCGSGLARCERFCLSFPPCSAPRCLDPCWSGDEFLGVE